MKKFLFVILICPFLFSTRTVRHYHVSPCYKADIIFIIDVSGSMDQVRPAVHFWMQGLAHAFPESDEVKIGLIHFAENTCAKLAPTNERGLLQEKVAEGIYCCSGGTYLLEALLQAHEYFVLSEQERGDVVPQIIILVSDGDVGDDKESIDFFKNNLHDVFFACINPTNPPSDLSRSRALLRKLAGERGIVVEGELPDIYGDLFKQLEPCF